MLSPAARPQLAPGPLWLIVDNGFAAAPDWSTRLATADAWLADARRRVVADLLWTTGISAPLSRLPAATRAGWQHCQLPGESAVPATALADRMLHPTPMLCMRRPDTVAR